jgi:hypothetical protein
MKTNNYLLGCKYVDVSGCGPFFVVLNTFKFLFITVFTTVRNGKGSKFGTAGRFRKTIFGLLVLAALFTLIRLLATIFKIYAFRRTLLKRLHRDMAIYIVSSRSWT